MKDGTKILLIILSPLILGALLFIGGQIHSLSLSDQQKMISESIEKECSTTFPGFTIFYENGSYSSITNRSKLCPAPTPDPAFIPETRIVTVAGYKDDWIMGRCTIITRTNERYTTWDGDPCIALTPGNTVVLTIGRKEDRESVLEKRIISATIINGDDQNGKLAV